MTSIRIVDNIKKGVQNGYRFTVIMRSNKQEIAVPFGSVDVKWYPEHKSETLRQEQAKACSKVVVDADESQYTDPKWNAVEVYNRMRLIREYWELHLLCNYATFEGSLAYYNKTMSMGEMIEFQ